MRGDTHPCREVARIGVCPAVVFLGLPVGAGGGDVAGRAARRPLRPQTGDAARPGAVCGGLGGVRRSAVERMVHRRSGAARPCRGGGDRDCFVRPDGAVQRTGATEGGWDLGGCEFPRAPDRADPRRLAVDALLVGLGVPNERSGRRDRDDRGARARAGVAGAAASWAGPGRGRLVRRRPGRTDLRMIEAGQPGWSAAGALLPMFAGVAALAGFYGWERRLTRRHGQALVDLTLFRSRSFTWGVILAAIALLAMIGVLFTMPQYFQGVLGTDAMGSGLRLVPLIAGLVVGAVPADQLGRRLGAKVTVALGFAVLTGGLIIGTSASGAFVAAWMAVVGAGMGLTLATASSAALSELSEERSGVGSAVLQAVQKIGGPFGTAILGSVLSSAYLARLDLSGIPAAATPVVRQSIFGGVAIAHQVHSLALLDSVRLAFVHGMDLALLVSAGFASAGGGLAPVFLPRANAWREATRGPSEPPVAVVLNTGATTDRAARPQTETERRVAAAARAC